MGLISQVVLVHQNLFTRPVARQDSSPDIAHFVSGKILSVTLILTWPVCVCVCGGGSGEGGGGEGGEQYLSFYTK